MGVLSNVYLAFSQPTLQMFLPKDKLNKLHELLAWFKFRKKKVKSKDLEKLGGLLAHCYKGVHFLAAFMTYSVK